MSQVQHVSASNFKSEVQQANVPVLVDFYADWCGPCRMLAPTLERLATEFAGRVKIVKVNVDREAELAAKFQVESIPMLVVIANGEIIGQAAGLVGEADLRSALNQIAPAKVA